MPAGRALFFVFAGGASAFAAVTPGSWAAERGRMIYENGTGADGRPVAAGTGAGRTPLPAPFVACANCHAADGRGREEGGVTAPDIRWETLDKPYGATRADGRRRPAYEAASFQAAVTQGLDAGGQALDPAMPRYALSREQTDGLAEYLQIIGRGAVPGVTDDVIQLGFIAPTGVTAERADLAVQVVRAWAEDVNRAGGSYRRRLAVTVLSGDQSEGKALTMFATLSGDASEAGGRAARALAHRGVPVLVAGRAVNGSEERRLFFLYPGWVGEARALVRHAVGPRAAAARRVAIVAGGEFSGSGELAAITTGVGSLPGVAPDPTTWTTKVNDSTEEALMRERPDIVLWLGESPALDAFAKRVVTTGWRPAILQAGGRSVPLPAGVWHAQATLPRDVSPAALAGYREFARRHGLPARELSFQFALLATARLLGEALENAGRELNREKLLSALETLADIKTGLVPPAGFSSRRHTAWSGVYVVPPDAGEGGEDAVWVGLD